jgi:hypothetical protein
MGGYRRELSKLKTQCVPQCNARTATFSRAARVQRFEVFPADADDGDRIAQRCALRTLATFGAVVNIPKLATCTLVACRQFDSACALFRTAMG